MQPGLDRAAAFLAQMYPGDSVVPIVAAVRRAPAPGKPYVAVAPVPADAHGAQVELVLVDPRALEEQRKKDNASPPGADRPMPDARRRPDHRSTTSSPSTTLARFNRSMTTGATG